MKHPFLIKMNLLYIIIRVGKSYDNPLFIPDIVMHYNEELCLESFYDKDLDDGPMLLDDKNYYAAEGGFDSTILETDGNYVIVVHEKHALCDSYIVEFVHDATENYYERGKYGCWSVHDATENASLYVESSEVALVLPSYA